MATALTAVNVYSSDEGWWYGSIVIKPDGTVEPSDAPIVRDGNVYTLTANVRSNGSGMMVLRSDIVIDGAGHIIEGLKRGFNFGVDVEGVSGITIRNIIVRHFYYGIRILESNYCKIYNSKIEENTYGIFLQISSNNEIIRNEFKNNGFSVWDSYNNTVKDNTVNGKPLICLEGVSDYVITYAGQVILVNCKNIRVEGVNTSDTDMGALLWNTSNSTISYSKVENNVHGIYLYASSENKIIGNTVTNASYGIVVCGSSNNIVSKNNVSNHRKGISLWGGNNNTVSGNYIQNNGIGIDLVGSSENTIYENHIFNNTKGISLQDALNNTIYHNNFINNSIQVFITVGQCLRNVWDNGYPSGGNYWSDYKGEDKDGDGIGDTPYVMDENNVDRYPLMNPVEVKPPPTPRIYVPEEEQDLSTGMLVGIIVAIIAIVAIGTFTHFYLLHFEWKKRFEEMKA